MDNPILLGLILVGVIGGLVTAFVLYQEMTGKTDDRLTARLDETFSEKIREKVQRSSVFRDLGKVAEEVAGENEGFRQRYEQMLEQSGIEGASFEKAMSVSMGLAVLGLVIGFIVFQAPGALIGGGVLSIIPTVYYNTVRNRRIEKMRSQLPEVFELMARIIRAGQTINQAMKAVADEFPQPISYEFRLVTEMMNLGVTPDAALQSFAKRSGIIEVKIFVMAMVIQRETGGNLAEVLDNLGHVVRERFQMYGKVAALTAEGRMQAYVLMCLPPGMVVIMLVLNRTYAMELINRPELLVGMFVSQSIGYFFIRKIVNFDF